MTQTTTQVTLISVLCLFLCTIHAQESILRGTISDAVSKETLISATVQVTGPQSSGTISDYNGEYVLPLPPGEYEVTVSYIGYDKVSRTVVLAAGEDQELSFQLTESAQLLQTAIVTSGKYEKPLGEVTVSLEVLRTDLIESTNKPSLDDALQKVPGVTVMDGQANIRGGSGYSYGAGSRVLLLLDDVPILASDSGTPNFNDIPVENIEQVEVVKGASSALYGSSALNGIINVKTAYAKNDPVTKASLFYTAYLSPKDKGLKWWDDTPYTAGASLSHRRKIGSTDLVLGGYYLNESSFRKDTYTRYGRFNFNVRHRIGDRFSFGLGGNFNEAANGSYLYWANDDMALVGNPSSVSERTNTRFNIDPFASYYDKKNGRHRLLSRFYRVENNSNANQSNFSSYYYAEYQYQKRIPGSELVFTSGLVSSGTNIEAELYGDTTFTSSNIAAYFQADKKFFDKLNASIGFRYERNTLDNPGFAYDAGTVEASKDIESQPVFRLGLNYQFAKASYLRASWGQGYRYPTVAEKYIFTDAGGFNVLPNPELGSETAWTAEVGLRQGFKLGSFIGFLDASVFQTRFQNMIEFNFRTIGFQSFNIGNTSINGAEINVAGQAKLFNLPLQFLAGYTYVNPTFDEFDPNAEPDSQAFVNAQNSTSDDNILKYRQKHVFKSDISLDWKRFNLGIESFYFSRLEAIDVVFNVIIAGLSRFREENANGSQVHNFRLAYKINEQYKVSFLLGNAFNETYTLRPALLEAPRNVSVRVSAKW